MTAKQRLTIEESTLKEKMNTLLALPLADLTDEHRAQMDEHTGRLQQLGPELRAAIASEGEEQQAAVWAFSDVATPEQAEIRELLQRVEISDYLNPVRSGTQPGTLPAEVNAALGVDIAGTSGGVAIPWRVLAGPEVRMATPAETRAYTTTAANDGPQQQRPILQRLFGAGIMAAMGVRLDEVPVGRSEWNILTGAVAPAMAKEGVAAAAAVSATFDSVTLRPKRLTGKYEYSHELAASVADIESALRRDLGDAVKAKMSDSIINGLAPTNTNPEYVEGFLSAITAPSNPSAVAEFSDYAGSHASSVDGIFAEMEKEVSSIIGTDVYAHAAGVYQVGSGESGSEALMRRSMSCRASSYIPAADNSTHFSLGNIYHSAGPNGGGVMRGDSVAAMWPTLEVVRDIYSQASQGVILTWIALWDAKAAFRPDAYKRVGFQIAT